MHRVLHSFPTRRSSDLVVADGEWVLPAATKTRSGRPAQAAARDRKSTRLNSSHQIISYAVFCLKKKTGSDPTTNSTSPVTGPPPQTHAPTLWTPTKRRL